MIQTDEELLEQMANHNQESFSVLYHRYWQELFITATKAVRDKDEAADVVQDVFLSFWNRREALNIQGSIPAYLHTSVRYKCIHYIEKNITRRDYIVELAGVKLHSSPANAEMNLQLREMQTAINSAVEKMPPKMQQVYNLSRHQHLSRKEIAAQLKISEDTVKTHIQRALSLIRNALSPHTLLIIILLFLCS